MKWIVEAKVRPKVPRLTHENRMTNQWLAISRIGDKIRMIRMISPNLIATQGLYVDRILYSVPYIIILPRNPVLYSDITCNLSHVCAICEEYNY